MDRKKNWQLQTFELTKATAYSVTNIEKRKMANGKFFSDVDFHISLVNKFKIDLIFNFKDKRPLAMRSSLVYKFNCARCASEYVGSTIRTLHTRVAEHTGRSFRTGSLLTVPPHSNIRQHALSCVIPVPIDNFKVMVTPSFLPISTF